MKTVKTVNVTVDWDDANSIKLAEKAKAKLEKKGYRLTNQFGGMFHSVLVYCKAS